MEELITLHVYAEDYDRLTSWQLAAWCKKHGADDWTVTAVTSGNAEATLLTSFDEMTKPFRLPKAKRRQLTAHGRVTGPDDFIMPTELWRLNSASFALLQEFLPDGLFTYRSDKDDWLEDPVLYRKGEFMLGVVSHEHEGIVRVTDSERRLLEAEGFAFRPFGSYVGY